MPSSLSRLCLTALAAAAAVTITSCGPSPSEEAAQAVYDACDQPEAKTDLVHLDGESVNVEVKGEAAKTMSGGDDAADNLGMRGEFDDGDTEGLAIMLATMSAVDCMVENTDFPGDSTQLQDGDEWDGWSYSEESGTGSEVTFTFTSTL